MRNWAGNHAYRAGRVHRPATLGEVREIVARAPRIRVLGSRHSFSDIADSDELLSLDGLPADVVVDRAAGTVSFGAALTYGGLAEALRAEGVALHNLASLPHISVGGAIATATHGSGDGNGNLATAVAALELVTSGGELVRFARSDPDCDGVVVGLGALGAVTRVTLDVEPAFEVAQRVFEGLAWDVLLARFDEVMASGTSVSAFTTWGAAVDQVWVKSRLGAVAEPPGELFGAAPAAVERHPIPGVDPVSCTPQLGVPGRWSERLPHFRMGFTPSPGEELQSEYHVPRRHAAAAIEAVRALAPLVRPVLQVSEIRTVAADALWMSPQHERDTASLHFTWRREPEAVGRLLVELEAALAPFDARPHWGKLFAAGAAGIARLYPRLPDFRRLAGRLDPRGAFRNAWLARHVLGEG
ncbi:MAG TPA: D-arabinono-1,4-lactone oxidase [Candidatus Dormibacteraeota bacterium]|nr:D-arabinono-1,4-lactone oxidase [Candidatus Dormibacteraeota bacterium]